MVADTQFETIAQQVSVLYKEALCPLAERYFYPLNALVVSQQQQPSVLFLGNHSSGKSSFINYLLGEAVQKVGVAPTDDGFTLLMFGDTPGETRGPAVLEHPQLPIGGIASVGSAFAARLRLRRLPSPLLRELTLIDSPGMIDAADSASERGYDFMGAVRRIAEATDLIVFFFDPDKPGTTGETVSAFTEALTGMEHKLLLVFNKVDQFESVPDFVRAYGALCWNLSRVVHTKDLPTIYSMYLPGKEGMAGPGAGKNFPLADFDRTRQEVMGEILRAPERRADNLVGTLADQISSLHIHVQVCSALRRSLAMAAFQRVVLTLLVLVTTVGVGTLMRETTPETQMWIYLGGLGVASTIWLTGWALLKRLRKGLIQGIDGVFEQTYEEAMALEVRQDLRERWNAVKPHTVAILERMGPHRIPLRPLGWQKAYRRLREVHRTGLSKLMTSVKAEERRVAEGGTDVLRESMDSGPPSPAQ